MPSDPETTTGVNVLSKSPDWMDAYRFAVVRLATFVAGDGQASRLAFASVELLAPNRPRPVSGTVQRAKAPGLGRRATVYFCRTAMGSRDAMAWYFEAAAGRLLTPIPLDPRVSGGEFDGSPVVATHLAQEPEWPVLALPLEGDPLLDPGGGGAYAPFVGAGSEPARVNRLVAESDHALDALVSDPGASEFLRRRLHVDLALYPEYRGGVVLFAPDPVVRSAHMFARPRRLRGERDEDLVVRVRAREGEVLEGLALTMLEVRAGSLTQFETVAVPLDGLVTFPRRQGTAMAGFTLTHRVRGVIRHQPPLPFLRQITTNTRVLKREVTVEAPRSESPSAATETYSSREYSAGEPAVIGGATGGGPLSLILSADRTRQRLAGARLQGQHWLDDPEGARVIVRRILSRASHRVWLADPYLGGNQVFQYLHAVGRLSVEIRLLTSRLAFQGERQADDPGDVPGDDEQARLARFQHGLQSLGTRGFSNIGALTLRGKSPRLHDRFLVVDDDVWFAGTSLNALGAREGLILKVPDPEAVIARLRQLMDESTTFQEFLTGRVAAARAKGGTNA